MNSYTPQCVDDDVDVCFVILNRLNVAPIKGFEDDVGTKTTMRLMYPESSKLDDEEYAKNWTLVIIPFKKNDIDWTDYIIDGQSEHRVCVYGHFHSKGCKICLTGSKFQNMFPETFLLKLLLEMSKLQIF